MTLEMLYLIKNTYFIIYSIFCYILDALNVVFNIFDGDLLGFHSLIYSYEHQIWFSYLVKMPKQDLVVRGNK